MFIGLVILPAMVFVLLFYASYSISAGVYVKSLCRDYCNKDAIALTFDDGVDPVMTPKVLNVLKKYHAKATFFIIGEKAFNYPEVVKMIIEQGHSIGNHSYRHKWYFPLKTTRSIYNEIKDCTTVLEKISGFKIKLFRPPFGVTNPMIAKALKRTGLLSIGWSIRSFDTIGQDLDNVKARVILQLKPGKVILLHDNRPDADILLEKILLEIERRSLKAITIDQLFNIS